MTDYEHFHTQPCPITGKGPAEMFFTDHDRPGPFNACRYCHDDQRTVGQVLHDLDDRRKGEAKGTP